MKHDNTERGYLLPKGCKDLNDVLRQTQHQLPKEYGQLSKEHVRVFQPWKKPAPLPPIKGEIIIPAQTSVVQLAALLNRTPSQIGADLLQIGTLASVSEQLDFEAISKIMRKYGFVAKQMA